MKLRLLAASATLAAASLCNLGAAQAATPSTPAGKALDYLATQQLADGSVYALGETADYALAAKFHGVDPNTLKAGSGKTVFDYFGTWIAGSVSCAAVGNSRDGNTVGKLVQVVVAGGHDPTSFAGRNLLSDLEGAGGTTGGAFDAATGTFEDCGSFDSKTGSHANAVYAQANAILALKAAANPTYPVSSAALEHLRALQQASGAWATFGSDNTNATAMALMALGGRLQVLCGAAPDANLTSALAYLHTQQDPASGGFTYTTAFGTATSDPDSDGLVIQALVAVVQDPGGASWTNSKGNPTTDILTFQDASTGGFKFDHGAATTPDAFTTSGAPAGIDRAPFPDGSAHLVAMTCPSPSPSLAAALTPSLPRAGDGLRRPPTPAPVNGLVAGLLGMTLLVSIRHRAKAGSTRDA